MELIDNSLKIIIRSILDQKITGLNNINNVAAKKRKIGCIIATGALFTNILKP